MRHTLTPSQLEWLSDKCDDLDLRLVTDYAGRGHHDRPAVGMIGQTPQIGMAALLMTAALNRESADMDWDDVLEHLDTTLAPDMDSFGMDSIAYWPAISA